ncbi:plasmid recombination protein [Vibrio vulnificus]|nr:plasmid recombination protein [Vibrio vulnificus]ELK8996629.1 plasmid recombination protein [Vibrio vulnificus]
MYQFFHIETYSISSKYNRRNPNSSSKSFSTIAKELMRHPDATPHISNPQQPTLLHGLDAYSALELAKQRAAVSKDRMGRKLRKDAQIVLSGVISCPQSFRDDSPDGYSLWLKDNLSYLKSHYGSNLVAVLLHEDESHPHIHFICLPEPDSNFQMHIKTIHEPIRAREETLGGRKAKFDAYKHAFRQLQDDYYSKVASKHGFTRDGANRTRMSRRDYIIKKKIALQISASHKIAQDNLTSSESIIKKSIELEKSILLDKNNIKQDLKKIASIKKLIKEKELNMINIFKKRNSSSGEVLFLKDRIGKLKNNFQKTEEKLKQMTDAYKHYKNLYTRQSAINANLNGEITMRDSEIFRLKNEIKARDKIILYFRSESDSQDSGQAEYNNEASTPRKESSIKKQTAKDISISL